MELTTCGHKLLLGDDSSCARNQYRMHGFGFLVNNLRTEKASTNEQYEGDMEAKGSIFFIRPLPNTLSLEVSFCILSQG